MKNVFLRAITFMAIVALAACTTPGTRTGTEVTRFHDGNPIPPQAINLEPADAADDQSLEFRSYENIIATELARLGFEPIEGDEAALIGVVEVKQTMEVQAPERSPFSIGIGGGSYGGSGGVGVGTSTDIGGSTGGEVVVTQLNVRLVDRAERSSIWEGQAVHTTQPGTENRPVATVQMLATALFQEFPASLEARPRSHELREAEPVNCPSGRGQCSEEIGAG